MAKTGDEMYALDAATGQILWSYTAGSSVNAAPGRRRRLGLLGHRLLALGRRRERQHTSSTPSASEATSGRNEPGTRAIIAECERRGWHLLEVIEDAGFSAKDMKRPGVQEALRVLEEGKASALVVAKLDRLSRSMIDFTALMGTAQKQHWALVALDCAVDTSTPSGEAMANMLATFAQFERRLISQRTKEALAVKQRAGRQARATADVAAGGRAADPAAACARRLAAEDRRGLERVWCGDCPGRRSVVRGDCAARPAPDVVAECERRDPSASD